MPNPTDSTIVRAAIHPGIGIARIGNSQGGYFIGPEITTPPPQAADYYRDQTGAIKRQAARFRIYGYNAAGDVVGELTADDADIVWTVHVANRKAQWYQFTAALDIPQSADVAVIRRNADFADRAALAIDPGPRSISGKSVAGGDAHAFNTGTFKSTTVVPLGEIRTDEAGRLLFLGGTGLSASPSGAPIFIPTDGDSFNNANDWYDDTSDGPVTATVAIGGKDIPVDAAWVVVAPPNYGPDMVSWRTMYDLLCDLYIGPPLNWGKPPDPVSFTDDVLPILQRLSNLQWVNKGYATMFGKGCPMDFHNPDFIGRLACQPAAPADDDIYKELRQSIYNMFRPLLPVVAEPVIWPHVWPWIYGDAYGSYPANGPGNMLTMTAAAADRAARLGREQFQERLAAENKRPCNAGRRAGRGPAGNARSGGIAFLPGRYLPSRLRDDVADAAPDDVRGAVSHQTTAERTDRTRLWSKTLRAAGAGAGRPAECTRAGRH